MISLSSSSLVASSNHLCNCGLRAEIRTCWNDEMMAQRFYCCGSQNANSCYYFKWLDDEPLEDDAIITRLNDERLHLQDTLHAYETRVQELENAIILERSRKMHKALTSVVGLVCLMIALFVAFLVI
ncbi:uncharacterized protein LOC135146951 [Daucus carota subsp. sativus]|uniref:uncharacterized protein LOC135146951 n=1 Tax=Daucus carota subsp. sativus TaxID=79200 RepID=UPI0030837CD8